MTKKKSTVESVTEQVTSAQLDANTYVINLQDLQNILVVFDLASNRGAFRGPELEPVGQLYNKISKFVKAAQPAVPVEDSTTTTTSDTVSA